MLRNPRSLRKSTQNSAYRLRLMGLGIAIFACLGYFYLFTDKSSKPGAGKRTTQELSYAPVSDDSSTVQDFEPDNSTFFPRVTLHADSKAESSSEPKAKIRCARADSPDEGIDEASIYIVDQKNQSVKRLAETTQHGWAEVSGGLGSVRLRCDKPGFIGLSQDVLMEQGSLVNLFMEQSWGISGVVRRAAGELAIGAKVQIFSYHKSDVAVATTVVDRQGQFQIRDIPYESMLVKASDVGQFSEILVSPQQFEIPIEMTLSKVGSSLFGMIYSSEKTFLPGALIKLVSKDVVGRGNKTISDERGLFSFYGLVPGEYKVIASKDDVEIEKKIHLKAQQDSRIEFVMPKSCALNVLPVLPGNELDAVAVVLNFSSKGEFETVNGYTGDLISFKGRSDREWHLVAYTKDDRQQLKAEKKSIKTCSAENPIRLELTDAENVGTLNVTVVDRNGLGVSGVEVSLEGLSNKGTTNEDGQISFPMLKAHRFGVWAAGEYKRVTVESGRIVSLLFELSATVEARLQGVVLSEGSPVAAARVLAECKPNILVGAPFEGQIVALTDIDGNFNYEAQEGSYCRVKAEHSLGRSPVVVIEAGGDPVSLDLKAGSSVEGVVVDTAGQPVVPSQVNLKSISVLGQPTVLDVSAQQGTGAFAFSEVPAGQIEITASSGDMKARSSFVLTEGQQQGGIELVLFSQGDVRGQVVDDNSQAVAGAAVVIRSQSAKLGETTTDKNGEFNVSIASGRPVNLYVSKEGFYPWPSASFDIYAGKPTDLGRITMVSRLSDEEMKAGLGIRFAQEETGLRVISFVDTSPAREAGLKVGDLIISVNGESLSDMPVLGWLLALRGELGTAVQVGVQRGSSSVGDITIYRRDVGLGPIPREMK